MEKKTGKSTKRERLQVGVLKVLDITFEILPKADNNQNYNSQYEQHKWQSILVDMLRICHSLDTPSLSESSLKLKNNSILDLYIERFIQEVNGLIHHGLIKRYRKEEYNSTSLNGKLLAQKHFAKNIVHKERFYVSKMTYDTNHVLNQILWKAIQLLPNICNNQYILSQCYQLKLNFPEVSNIKVDATLFDKISFDRKSERYKTAIAIAKLLLLNYRPDIASGATLSIAILFNMNKLWEEYIYRMLLKANSGKFKIYKKRQAEFWRQDRTSRILEPDIVLERLGDLDEEPNYIVLDTKWKNIKDDTKNVSMEDIRQMFAYHHYFDASKCYLLYPGIHTVKEGNFSPTTYFKNTDLGSKSCGVILCNAWHEQFDNGYLNRNIGTELLKVLDGKNN